MRNYHRVCHTGVVLFAALAMANCSPEPLDYTQRFARAVGKTPAIGLTSALPPDAELGVIHAGRILPESGVVLLDYVKPLVKVFDAQGRFVAGFGDFGVGPGRFQSLTAIGVAKGVVMLGDAEERKVELHKTTGELLWASENIQFAPLAAVSLRDGAWLFYGPSAANGATRTWLHCLRLRDKQSIWTAGFMTRDSSDELPTDVPRLISNGNDATVLHRLARDSVVLRVRCGDRSVDVIDRMSLVTSELEGRGLHHGENSPVVGMVTLNSGILLAVADGQHLRLLLCRGGRTRIVGWMLTPAAILDGAAGRTVLVLRWQPSPHVVVMPATVFAPSEQQ